MNRLTKTGLGEALLAALGLYFCVRASSQLAGLAGATEEVFSGGISLAFFLPFAVLGLWGLLLVIFRRRLAIGLFGQEVGADHEGTQSFGDLKPFLIAAIGIWFVASGLINAASIESQTLVYSAGALDQSLSGYALPRAFITRQAWLSRIPYISEVLVGLALFLSSDSLTDLWVRLRSPRQSQSN